MIRWESTVEYALVLEKKLHEFGDGVSLVPHLDKSSNSEIRFGTHADRSEVSLCGTAGLI